MLVSDKIGRSKPGTHWIDDEVVVSSRVPRKRGLREFAFPRAPGAAQDPCPVG